MQVAVETPQRCIGLITVHFTVQLFSVFHQPGSDGLVGVSGLVGAW